MPGNWTHTAHLLSPSHQSGVSVFQYPLCSIFFLLVLKPASCFTKSNSGLLGKKKKAVFAPDGYQTLTNSQKNTLHSLSPSLSPSLTLSPRFWSHTWPHSCIKTHPRLPLHTHKGISHFRVLKKYKRIPILIMKTEAGGVPINSCWSILGADDKCTHTCKQPHIILRYSPTHTSEPSLV